MGDLHDAARAGDLDALRAMIDAGADLDAAAEPRDPDPKGPPAETGAELVIRYGLFELIWPSLRGESTIKGRRKDRNGPTALMIAAAAGRSEVVDALLAAGASPDLRDRDGFTALAYGAALGRAGIVRALIAAGADVDPIDHYEKSPIILAALKGHADAIRALAEAGAGLAAAKPQALAPLHAAAGHGHTEAVRALLEAGADPDAIASNATPLDMALGEGHIEIVRVLARGGTDLDRGDWRGLTPPMNAVAMRDRATLRILLEAGADPNAPAGNQCAPSDGRPSLPARSTALHLAACLGDPEIVGALLAAGADPGMRDEQGFTPLMLATASRHTAAATLLREACPPPEPDVPALGALELVGAVRHGDAARVRELLDSGVTPDVRTPPTFKYHYLLRCRAAKDFFDASTAKGEGSFGDEDRSVLSLALGLGHEEIAVDLIAAGAAVEDRTEDDDAPGQVRSHPLIGAAEEGRVDSLVKLLAAGAKVGVKDHDGRTPIFAAAEKGHAHIVRALIAAEAKVNLKDVTKETPLSVAASEGHAEVLRVLLQGGAKVRPDDLGRATVGGHIEAARVLLEASCARKVKPDASALSGAVWSGSIELVQLLLDSGFDVDAPGDDGPVIVTASFRSFEVLRLLIDSGADVSARRPEGSTALSMAVVFANAEVVRLLLEHGADTEAEFDGVTKGETPLIRAAGHGLAAMAGRFLDPEKTAGYQSRDDGILRALIEHGADTEARDRADGRTALMHAAYYGRENAVRILIEAGSETDARDEWYGRTALMWAAIEGHAGVVRILLTAGADPRIEDLDG